MSTPAQPVQPPTPVGALAWRRATAGAPPAPQRAEDFRICGVAFEGGQLQVSLMSRRVFTLDLAHYPALARASFEERMGWMVVDGGHGLAWPMLGLGTATHGGLINSRHLLADDQPSPA